MHYHNPHRGRSHTHKQNAAKSKITVTERQKRIIRKKLLKLFASWKTLHPLCNKTAAKPHSVPSGTECKVRSKKNHQAVTLTKFPLGGWEYRRLRV